MHEESVPLTATAGLLSGLKIYTGEDTVGLRNMKREN